ncbi:hypothetical protein Tco_1337189 [Tanacetum coccineum]
MNPWRALYQQDKKGMQYLTPNEQVPRTSQRGGPRRQETMGIQLLRLGLRMYLNIPMIHCSQELKTECQELEKKEDTRTSQSQKIILRLVDPVRWFPLMKLVWVIKRMHPKRGVLNDEEVFAGLDMAEKEINVAEKEVSTANPVTTASEVVTTASPTETTTADDLTLAQTLIEIRSAKSKSKGCDRKQQEKDQISMMGSCSRFQAQMQHMIDADVANASQQMQAEEQEKLSIEEKSKLFVQLLKQGKEHFEIKSTKKRGNKPPTKAQ